MRAGGIEPPQAFRPDGFSYQLRLSPPSMTYDLDVCGLDYPFTIADAVGAARLVSTPSLSGLARDCHVTGFPEFGQFYFLGFPEEHSNLQVRCVYRSATPA